MEYKLKKPYTDFETFIGKWFIVLDMILKMNCHILNLKL